MKIATPAALCLIAFTALTIESSSAFVPSQSSKTTYQHATKLRAAPRRLEENVDGPLFVNEKCINCAACSMFAPTVFSRSPLDKAHMVHHQPESEVEISDARAALAACPVAAIRVETKAHLSHRNLDPMTPEHEKLVSELAISPKFNGRPVPFPRPVSNNVPDVYFLGHHNEASFGAVPYLLKTQQHGWILVDTPKFSKSAVQAVEQLTGSEGPSYMLLTHVDDTAGHNNWKENYPNLQRIFHVGDLGRHNWLGDETLEYVEILLHEASSQDQLQYFDIQGNPIEKDDVSQEVVVLHTPGHSPGSTTLWRRPVVTVENDSDSDSDSDSSHSSPGILFTGDTYAFSTRDNGRMTGFPRYGNDLKEQSKILPRLLDLDWQFVAPGHGHIRDYTAIDDASSLRETEMLPAIQDLQQW